MPVTPHAWQDQPLPVFPSVLGNAHYYEDAAATGGSAIGYINAPGCGIEWRALPAGSNIKIRYAAEKPAQLTLQIHGNPPQKIAFPATGKWQGHGAYAEVTVPVKLPAKAVVSLTFNAGDAPANIDSLVVIQ